MADKRYQPRSPNRGQPPVDPRWNVPAAYYPPQYPYPPPYVPYPAYGIQYPQHPPPQQPQFRYQPVPPNYPTPQPQPPPNKNKEQWKRKDHVGGTPAPAQPADLQQSFQKLTLNDAATTHSALVGRVHTVVLKEFSPEGIVVRFPQTYINDQNENVELTGLLPWGAFSTDVQAMEQSDRESRIQGRIPVGSTFNVYANCLQSNNQLLLTLALKPDPILNYPVLPASDVSASEPSSPLRERAPLRYRYLIILDFEATCDYSPKPIIDKHNSEIIEFPWVVLDTHNFDIVYEKQLYIKPDNMKGITPYCRALTDITEEIVAQGCTLRDAIDQFNTYVAQLPKDSFRILTDGVWDLQVQLKQEAQRKGIQLEQYFTEYFDLKEEFKKFLPWFPFKPHEPPLTLMLKSLRLNFVGRHHAGLDDCHSIASVVKAMIRQGCMFDTPTLISPTYDYSQDPSYVSFSSKAPPDSWKCLPCTEKYKPHSTNNNSSNYNSNNSSTNTNNNDAATNNDSNNSSNNNNNNDDDDHLFLGVWNKPNSQACRFCGVARPFDINQGRTCVQCGILFTLTPSEVEFYQSRNWFFPRNCAKCRHYKAHSHAQQQQQQQGAVVSGGVVGAVGVGAAPVPHAYAYTHVPQHAYPIHPHAHLQPHPHATQVPYYQQPPPQQHPQQHQQRGSPRRQQPQQRKQQHQ